MRCIKVGCTTPDDASIVVTERDGVLLGLAPCFAAASLQRPANLELAYLDSHEDVGFPHRE